jgi:hypothetical protein
MTLDAAEPMPANLGGERGFLAAAEGTGTNGWVAGASITNATPRTGRERVLGMATYRA